jgi:hypothetical protein
MTRGPSGYPTRFRPAFMENGFNIHNIFSYKVVDPIREPLQSPSPKRGSVDWKCIGHTRNPLESGIDFHEEAKSQIQINL